MYQVHRKKVFVFIALTCVISWSFVGVFQYAGYRWNTADSFILMMAFMLVPSFSALISMKIIFKERFREKLALKFTPDRWWVVAWVLPVILVLLTLFISLIIPFVGFSGDLSGFYDQYRGLFTSDQILEIKRTLLEMPMNPFWVIVVTGMIAGITVNALFSLGEETGWRGYLFFELKSLSFWKSSLITGAIWGTWYFPVVLLGFTYPQHPKTGVLFMIVFCILISPLIGFLRVMSGSVFPAAIFHGTLNAIVSLGILMTKGGSDLIVGLTGLSGFLVLLSADLLIFFRYKSRLEERYLK